MVQTGVRLLGLLGSESEQIQGQYVIGIFSVPCSGRDLLLSVSGDRLALWSDWSAPNYEKLQFEVSLDSMTDVMLKRNSMNGGDDSYCCRGLDAVLMPGGKASKKGVVAVAILVACGPKSSFDADDEHAASAAKCSLWIHVVEFAAGSGNPGESLVVRSSCLVDADLPSSECGLRKRQTSGVTSPRLYAPDAARKLLYATWEGSDTQVHIAVVDCDYAGAGSDTSLLTPLCSQAVGIAAASVIAINVSWCASAVNSAVHEEGLGIILEGEI
jgi:hypothetical protein